MTTVLELIEKLGASLISLGALAFLFKSIRYYEKLRKDLPLSKGEFETWQEEKYEKRIQQIEKFFSKEWAEEREQHRIMWKVGGFSNPRQAAMSPVPTQQTVIVKEVSYVEQVEDVEKPRFRTGEHSVFAPSTEKPPPARFRGKSWTDTELTEDEPTTPTEPEGRKRRK